MPVIARPRSFFNKFKFLVEIDGITYAGFTKCSELSMEFAKIEHYEGGSLIPNKSPGRLTFADVTLDRGATTDRQLLDWCEQVGRAIAGLGGAGLIEPIFKRTLDIVQLERDDSSAQRYTLYNAWPPKYVEGDWDNESDSKRMNQVVLAYDYWTRTP